MPATTLKTSPEAQRLDADVIGKRWFRLDRWGQDAHPAGPVALRTFGTRGVLPLRFQVWEQPIRDVDGETVWVICREFLPTIIGAPMSEIPAEYEPCVCVHMGEFEE